MFTLTAAQGAAARNAPARNVPAASNVPATRKVQAIRRNSPLGPISLLMSAEHQLLGLWFDDQVPKAWARYRAAIAQDLAQAQNLSHSAYGAQTIQDWLEQYFAGHIPSPLPEMELMGTEFEVRVWHELLTIPYGQTTTYGALAQRLFPERSTLMARAVGQAVGSNPIALIVPCHRVLGAQGQLTGYAYGLERKKQLLALEGIVPTRR